MTRVRSWTCVLICALACVLPATAQVAPDTPTSARRPWPHEGSDLAPDPGALYESLPNGMRYVLMRNQLPAGQVALHLAFDFGSLHEADDEHGLAHFIEHMAFNGSTHAAEGEMTEFLGRLGMQIGSDVNAGTSHTNTLYMLNINQATETNLDQSLFFLREVASELLFDPGAIDRERGVVLSEYRVHRSPEADARRAEEEAIAPGSPLTKRTVIGDPGVIQTAPRERMVSLYERFYRPQRATLLVVGDFDVASMRAKIAQRFGDWVGRGLPGTDPDLRYAPPSRPLTARVHAHPLLVDSVSVAALSPARFHAVDSRARRHEYDLTNVAARALFTRIGALESREDPPFRNSYMLHGGYVYGYDIMQLGALPGSGGVKAALATFEQERRRAVLHGLTRDEIEGAITDQLAPVRAAAKAEAVRSTGWLMQAIEGALLEGAVFTTPSAELARLEASVGAMTPELLKDELKQRLTTTEPILFVRSSAPASPSAEAELVQAWQESTKVEVTAPADKPAPVFAYTDFGPAGQVVADTRRDDVGARLVTFANGVRLTLKHTAIERDSLLASVRVGHGGLDLPETPPGLDALAAVFAEGGTEKHSFEELLRIARGRAVTPAVLVQPTAVGAIYQTSPDDLLLQLQLAAAFTVAPGYRREAEQRWRNNVALSARLEDSSSRTLLLGQVDRALASDDPRFYRLAEIKDRTFAELAPQLEPALKRGPVEITLVGDFDDARAIDAVARTFGALPPRDAPDGKLRRGRPYVFRRDEAPLVLTHAGEASDAIAAMAWPVALDPERDPKAELVASVLGSVLQDKVVTEVREALGVTYSPSAGLSTYQELGLDHIRALAQVEPVNVQVVLDVYRDIAAQMRAGAISDAEFARAVGPQLAALPTRATSNWYWAGVLQRAHSRPQDVTLNLVATQEAALRAVTKADVIAAARTWLIDEAAQELRILPRSTSGAAPSAAALPSSSAMAAGTLKVLATQDRTEQVLSQRARRAPRLGAGASTP